MISTLNKKNNIRIEGNPDAGKTIVFANGFGTDQTAWARVKPAFAADYKLVLFDNVGGGQADPAAFSPVKYNHLNTYAEDLVAIAEELQLEDAIVVAHSVSSMITLLASILAPRHFSKLIFVGGSPRYLDDESDEYTGGFTQPLLDDMFDTMTTNYYAWVSGFSSAAMGNPQRPELSMQFADTLAAIRPDIALAVAKVIFASDVRAQLPKLQKETLLIHSQNDIAVPDAVAHYLHKNIAGSKLLHVNAEGHFPHISAPQEIIKAIQSFI